MLFVVKAKFEDLGAAVCAVQCELSVESPSFVGALVTREAHDLRLVVWRRRFIGEPASRRS